MFKFFLIFAAGILFLCLISCGSGGIKIKESGAEGFTEPDIFPEPIGGIEAIQNNFYIPPELKDERIEGKIYIIAFVNEKGEVAKTVVARGLHPLLDEIASKAVQAAKFKPALADGKPVKCQLMIPIVIRPK